MRIGIDVDNVLSNFNEELLKAFLKHDKTLRNKGIINKEADFITKGMFDWSKDELDDFYYSNIEKIAKNLKVIDKAPEYIKKLKEDGHEIYIISGRDNGEYSNPYEMTEKWLKLNDIEYNKLILTNAYNSIEKAKICISNNINLMIDDSTTVCNEIQNSGINCLLMDTLYNRKNNDFKRVNSWQEIYEYTLLADN